MNKTVHLLYLCVIISYFIHCCYGSEAGEDITEQKRVKRDGWAESHKSNANTVMLPVAVIYVFGIGLLLVILLLIFLIIVLVKTKFLEICKKNKNEPKNVETGNSTNLKQQDNQKSLKRLNLNTSHSFEFKNKSTQYQVLKENDSSNTLQLTKDEFGTLRTPTSAESTGNLSPRIMKGITKGMPIILPEQMSQICKEVLTRTNKNDESTGSLQDIIAKEKILEDETEKKYASSPVLDLCDIPPSTINTNETPNERSSNKEYFGSQTEIHSNDTYDMPKELNNLSKYFDSKTDLLSDNIYDMPKELENLSKDNIENQIQIHNDNTYDLPKEQNSSNKEKFDSKMQVPSNDIYDMPKDIDNAQINYTRPFFPFTQELKETFKKPDYAFLQGSSRIKEGEIDKIATHTEQNAYDFPANTQTEGKLYINANRVL